MRVIKSLRYKITSHTRILDATVDIYNEALTFLIDVIGREKLELNTLSTKDVVRIVEKLVHATRSNPSPVYKEFDKRFCKFPSYFRRSAIADAAGLVKSHRSNYENWIKERDAVKKEGRIFHKKPPLLQKKHNACPAFYKGNMFKRLSDTTAQIKIFHQNDWIWLVITFKAQDLVRRGVSGWKEHNPILVKEGKKYSLSISYEHKTTFPDNKLQDQKICAVSLGTADSAVCSVMNAKGDVLARTFINQPKEKDRLHRISNKLRKVQTLSGSVVSPNYQRRINGLERFIITDTSHRIVQFARDYQCDVIVLEYLDTGYLSKRILDNKYTRFQNHYWHLKRIHGRVEEMAHYAGMRISYINPQNTETLAFDGSGKVKASCEKNMVIFSTGKVYHAGLNASYNIGARYFIRLYQKSLLETEWLPIQAKVPELAQRTAQNLSSLIALGLA